MSDDFFHIFNRNFLGNNWTCGLHQRKDELIVHVEKTDTNKYMESVSVVKNIQWAGLSFPGKVT